jgi:thiol:disulfide interchange protein
MAQPIAWSDNLNDALERARNEKRTVLVDFTAAPM